MERVAGLAGIGFAVLFVAGAFVASTPDEDQPAKWVTWYASRGHRIELLVNGYLWVVAGLCVGVMIAAAYQRFGRGTGLSGLYAVVAGVGAIVFAGVMVIAGVTVGSVAGNVMFGGAVPKNGDILIQLTEAGYAFVLVAGGLSAALALAAVSLLILREGGPRWLAALGFIATICCIVGVFFIPMVALPIWILVASLVLVTRRSEEPIQAPSAAPAT